MIRIFRPGTPSMELYPLFNFLFTYLFLIKKVFIISPFTSFIYIFRVHISIQSYGNNSLLMSVLYSYYPPCARNIQAVVTIRLYEYMDTNTTSKRKKRRNKREILLKKRHVNRQLTQRWGWGGVVIPCH